MRYLFILCCFFYLPASAQNDLLVLKKNNKTIQSFYPGSPFIFSTANGNFNTYITGIQKDSIYVVQYDIRTVPTNLGIYVLDTVARYNFGINYRDIISLGKMNNHFDWSASGGALFGGLHRPAGCLRFAAQSVGGGEVLGQAGGVERLGL